MHISIKKLIRNRILEHGPGWCFTPIHFSDLGSATSIRKALSTLEKEKFIRRLSQGIYDYPKKHDLLGAIPPDLNLVAKAIAEKNGTQIQPAGALAANLVGFSTQVPGQVVFLTEGPTRRVIIDNQTILFKKTTKKVMSSAETKEGLLIQALKNIGKDHIDQNIRKKTAKFLQDSSVNEIKNNIKFAPEWIRVLIFEILEIKP